MTDREAMRLVCRMAACILDGALSAGDGWIDDNGDRSDADVERVEMAIRKLSDQMRNRGNRRE